MNAVVGAARTPHRHFRAFYIFI